MFCKCLPNYMSTYFKPNNVCVSCRFFLFCFTIGILKYICLCVTLYCKTLNIYCIKIGVTSINKVKALYNYDILKAQHQFTFILFVPFTFMNSNCTILDFIKIHKNYKIHKLKYKLNLRGTT